MTEHQRRQRSSAPTGDRVPPHNLDAEQSALGAALVAPAAATTFAASLDAGDFYRPIHQHIAAAIIAAAETGDRVDAVIVAEHLRRAGLLDEIGGYAYLAELQSLVPSISNVERYARIVRDTSTLRNILATAAKVADVAYAADNPGAALARAAELMGALGSGDTGIASTLEIANIAVRLANGLVPEEASFLRRTDGGALIYAGRMHTLQAEPSAGKSWLALYTITEVLLVGGTCVYIDYEDVVDTGLRRLLALGVTTKMLEEQFHHIVPSGKLGLAERAELFKFIADVNPDVVVIDGVANALAREGLSEDSAPDYVRWVELLPRPIARTGAAVLMLDHVVKDREQQGRWARGTGAKLAEIDGAAYQVKVRVPFSRHRAGMVDLVIAKDRPGGVGSIGETAARIHVEPHAGGEVVRMRVEPPAETAPTDGWKPTVLMGKVWEAIDQSVGPITATQVKAMVHSDKPKLVQEAVARLIAEGYVAERTRSGRRGKHLEIVKPYDGAPPRTTTRTEHPVEQTLPLEDPGVDPDYLASLSGDVPVPYYEHQEF